MSDLFNKFEKRPYYAYLYALNVLKKRLPKEVEKVFLDDAESASLYAINVIKGKLPNHIHNYLLLNNEDKEYVVEYLNFLESKE